MNIQPNIPYARQNALHYVYNTVYLLREKEGKKFDVSEPAEKEKIVLTKEGKVIIIMER